MEGLRLTRCRTRDFVVQIWCRAWELSTPVCPEEVQSRRRSAVSKDCGTELQWFETGLRFALSLLTTYGFLIKG